MIEETFTSLTTGQAIKVGLHTVFKSFALEVEQVGGSGASWTVLLEGSLDGVNYTTILTHADEDPGSGQIIFSGAAKYPALWHRVRVLELSLGSATGIKVRRLAA